jgi:hypothetical protein
MRNSLLLMAVAVAALVIALQTTSRRGAGSTADLILVGGAIYTVEPDQPRAEAVAVRDGRILAVGDDGDIARYRGPATAVVDLDGAFVVPGFIDNHTHFDYAARLLLGINLLDVADADLLAERVAAARDRLPEGAWILDGDWGAYEEWEMGSTGREEGAGPAERFKPHREMIDALTPETPVLLSRWDGSEFLANGVALELTGITRATRWFDGSSRRSRSSSGCSKPVSHWRAWRRTGSPRSTTSRGRTRCRSSSTCVTGASSPCACMPGRRWTPGRTWRRWASARDTAMGF